MTRVLRISDAARLLGVTRPMVYRLIDRGFLKEPHTEAAVRRAWKRWEADKAARATIREAPSALADALAFERVRALELGNSIKRRDLVRLDHSLLGAEIVAGLLRSDAHALEGSAVASGADRGTVEDMTAAAMGRASALFEQTADALRADGVEEAPAPPEPIAVSLRDRERAARIAKRKLANDKVEADHIATSAAVAVIDNIVEVVEGAFTDVPNAEQFVIAPLKARAAKVIDALRAGIDPDDLDIT
jgi:hypothetical protein